MNRKILKRLGVGMGVTAILFSGWAIYTDIKPSVKNIEEILKSQNIEDSNTYVGENFTAANLFLIDTLLNKRGGYLSNHPLALAGLVDNMPEWEFGALEITRDSVLVLRDHFSRSRSNSSENKNLLEAAPLINYHNDSFILPSSVSQYKESHTEIKQYLNDIIDPSNQEAQFYARSDNLVEWLRKVSSRLGSTVSSLTASVGEERVNTDLANDNSAEQTTISSNNLIAKTPWSDVDNVFWKARGGSYALLHLMQGAEKDFESVLQKKNAVPTIKSIVRDLKSTQKDIFYPFISNGSGFGKTPNYSLILATYISRVHRQVDDLIIILEKG